MTTMPLAWSRSAPATEPATVTPLAAHLPRTARARHYLMCQPTYFTVSYAINPWMNPDIPVDPDLAMRQWEALRDAYRALGHTVSLIDPVPGLPDMVFAANGGLVVDGKLLAARFRAAERRAEGPAYRDWFDRTGQATAIGETQAVNEGEGDFLALGGMILAGTGFRTDPAAHAQAQEFFGRPVISLQLVDPRFYHLDTALAALTDHDIAYYPAAFSPGSRAVLEQLFPDAIRATEADALAFGLNAVSDGRHVVLPAEASELTAALSERGFEPVPVQMSEFRKSGGGPKCCTLELRA